MAINAGNSFRTRDKLNVGAQTFDIHRLEFLEKQGVADLAKLPFSLRILLENLVRCEDGRFVHAEDIRALAGWRPGATEKEIAFMPARVLLQDFTGVPARGFTAGVLRSMEIRWLARMRTPPWSGPSA